MSPSFSLHPPQKGAGGARAVLAAVALAVAGVLEEEVSADDEMAALPSLPGCLARCKVPCHACRHAIFPPGQTVRAKRGAVIDHAVY